MSEDRRETVGRVECPREVNPPNIELILSAFLWEIPTPDSVQGNTTVKGAEIYFDI